jgi:hypothetical protein
MRPGDDDRDAVLVVEDVSANERLARLPSSA